MISIVATVVTQTLQYCRYTLVLVYVQKHNNNNKESQEPWDIVGYDNGYYGIYRQVTTAEIHMYARPNWSLKYIEEAWGRQGDST